MHHSFEEIAALLDKAVDGNGLPATKLLQVLYLELRKLAASQMERERPGHTLQPTALVHEAWLRLGGDGSHWASRGHFFGAAAEAMRRILVESARRKRATRHGGGQHRVDSEELQIACAPPAEELLAVHEALDEFARHDAEKAELVKLRYFVGLSIEEAAAILGISPRTAKRNWTFARAWLANAIRRDGVK